VSSRDSAELSIALLVGNIIIVMHMLGAETPATCLPEGAVMVRPPCWIKSGILGFRDLGQDYKDGFQSGGHSQRGNQSHETSHDKKDDE